MDAWLMCKDQRLLNLYINGNDVFIRGMNQVIPFCISDMQYWVEHRFVPAGRENISRILKFIGVDSNEEFIKVSKAISLTDDFWIRAEDDNTQWDDINPFTHRLSRVVSEAAINMYYQGGNLRTPSPDYTVDGSVPKCWRREDGRLYLYKTCGATTYGNSQAYRPYAEYYACQFMSALCKPFKQYNIFVKYNMKNRVVMDEYGNRVVKPYVYSEAFTSEKYGFIPICDTYFARKSNNEIIEYFVNNGDILSNLRFQLMLLLDAIILNNDRHTGNYGFMLDNDKLELSQFAPVYDNDCSLGARIVFGSKKAGELIEEVEGPNHSFAENMAKQGQAVVRQHNSLYNYLKSLTSFKFERLSPEVDVPDRRLAFMETIIRRQIHRILEL